MPTPCLRLNADDPADLAHAAGLLRDGGLVAMPTETVYGLAANALSPTAVAKIFAAKERPAFDPLIVHVDSLEMAQALATFDATARALAERFWPGPLTIVLPRTEKIGDLVTSGLETVGLRIPDHAAAKALIASAGLPLAAPSANRFGAISPTTADHVAGDLGGRIDAVLDGGTCARGIESTVVSVRDGGVTVLRLGATPVEAIENVVPGRVTIAPPSSSPGLKKGSGVVFADDCSDSIDVGEKRLPTPFSSPGMTKRHYAPRTPMRFVDSLDELNQSEREAARLGLIGMGDLPAASFAQVENLSPKGDDVQAAANLFAALRRLDSAELDGIIALAVPEQGLGRAINDRLKRGSAR